MRKYLLLCGCLWCLQGCVILPKTTESFDENCKVASKHMELESVQIAALHHCHGHDCIAFLAAAGASATVTGLISGSIAVVGNIVYWLEKQGRCKRE